MKWAVLCLFINFTRGIEKKHKKLYNKVNRPANQAGFLKSMNKIVSKTNNSIRIKNKKNTKVFVVECTKEGLKIELGLGPLKFERSKKGGDFTSRKTAVATI